jgi:uncharacterized protein
MPLATTSKLSAKIVLVSLLLASGVVTAQAVSHSKFLLRLATAAVERTQHPVRYTPDYVRIPYPAGDVPVDTGVCTDEVIRSYRAVGIDLQKEVHEDMVRNFGVYPHGRQRHPDSNIDHRRVPNLMVFLLAARNAVADEQRLP